MPTTIAIAADTNKQKATVKRLAERLHLLIAPTNTPDFDLLLVKTAERLELRETKKDRSNPVFIDFVHGELAHRRKYGGGRGQLIAKAIGVKPGKQLSVIDTTAGLGRDAFVLACLGCKVQMLERSNIIAALLEDGIKRAKLSGDFANIKITLANINAIDYLVHLKKSVDVIYIDPMFPHRTKSALVKKEMRIVRQIVGEDLDAPQLLQTAMQSPCKRIVVKRPKLAPPLSAVKPDLIFKGKSGRFDIYLGTDRKFIRNTSI